MDRQTLLKTVAERAWQASHPSAESPVTPTLQNPLPVASHAWLRAAAAQFDADEPAQQQFAETGLLQLDALHVVVICQSEEPVPLWLAVGYLRTPQAIHPETWQQLLLRANGIAMAMNGISLSLDEQGTTLLTRRLAFDAIDNAVALAEIMNDLDALAASLIDLLFSPGQPDATQEASEEPSPPDWVAGWQQQTALKIDALAEKALAAQWHYPLMQQTITALQLPAAQYSLNGCLCSLRFPERDIAVTADGNGRHLFLATPLDLNPDSARQFLLANGDLQLLTHCSLGLYDEQVSLLSRWDSFGLDGIDFAEWLANFMTLTQAFNNDNQRGTL
ncbi:type III secretion system chaperone [Kalamiella sp. sgz302252]|uniref:type III secretion system chaperone n=1 Tax=Pantoea sp. sgz302252 TaxID=3341827 RepID=UPI0036D34BBE